MLFKPQQRTPPDANSPHEAAPCTDTAVAPHGPSCDRVGDGLGVTEAVRDVLVDRVALVEDVTVAVTVAVAVTVGVLVTEAVTVGEIPVEGDAVHGTMMSTLLGEVYVISSPRPS